ncbi:MAG: GMP synthase (glutamine-hydrolyzing), partial [Dehalococcoidales bacterium]|nr:GMP synthase (glutamine-hydrolyzing) [Dehalococcoidales bacterium]
MDEQKTNDPGTSHRVSTSGDIEVTTYLEIAKMGDKQPASASESAQPAKKEAIIVIDFGSQYSMLIARRIRECQVYCEMVSYDTPWEKIASLNPKGFILSGGPSSVYQDNAPMAPSYIYESHLPVLGICYGMQVITKQLGGQVTPGNKNEYGHAVLHLSQRESPLFASLPETTPVWMSHGDK